MLINRANSTLSSVVSKGLSIINRANSTLSSVVSKGLSIINRANNTSHISASSIIHRIIGLLVTVLNFAVNLALI